MESASKTQPRWQDNWKTYLGSVAESTAKKYIDWVERFDNFCASDEQKGQSLSQNVLDFAESYHEIGHCTSTLWSSMSPIKRYLKMKFNFNIDSEVPTLQSLFKNWEKEETVTKSAVFTRKHLESFLTSAPSDEKYLPIKVAAVVSTFGLLRTQEQADFRFDDLSKEGNIYVGQVARRKGKGPKQIASFFIQGEVFVKTIDEYVSKFSDQQKQLASCENRLLRKFNVQNQPTAQVIGKNTIGQYPRKIADYLKLSNAEEYTGHAFRRTGATLLANSGVQMLTLKMAGGWNSDKIAQSYIAESDVPKMEIASRIATGGNSSQAAFEASSSSKVPAGAPAKSQQTTQLQAPSTTTNTMTFHLDLSNSTFNCNGGNFNIFVPSFDAALNPLKRKADNISIEKDQE